MGWFPRQQACCTLLDSKQADTKETGVFIALGKMPVQISDVMLKSGTVLCEALL